MERVKGRAEPPTRAVVGRPSAVRVNATSCLPAGKWTCLLYLVRMTSVRSGVFAGTK